MIKHVCDYCNKETITNSTQPSVYNQGAPRGIAVEGRNDICKDCVEKLVAFRKKLEAEMDKKYQKEWTKAL